MRMVVLELQFAIIFARGILASHLHAHACTSCACIFGVGCHFYFRLFTKAKSLGKSWSLKFGIPVEHADRKDRLARLT